MRFRTWIESEASLNSIMPEAIPTINRGSDTPASDEVKRTGLQPQVGAEEIETHEKDEQDKILAIDGALKRLEKEIPNGKDDDFPKVNKFKKLWNNLREKWEIIKSSNEDADDTDEGGGLANTIGNEKYVKTMQQFPNMVPIRNQSHSGPGIFGVS
jgi:hypothetical protein